MDPAADPRLVLVDAPGYVFRAFFALPPMTRADGTPVSAVLGFTNMLLRFLQDRPTDDVVVVFDHSEHSFRNDLYDGYKATRDALPADLAPQFALVREAARAFDLPVVELPRFEADDIIATLARRAQAAGREVLVVSSDKDLMQLVGERIAMWDPMKAKAIGPAEVMEKFGVAPERVRDVLALMGDTSDNVPGVPGIGQKTAALLIDEFGSLHALLAGLDRIKQPKRREGLATYADQARLSYALVGLDEDAPVALSLEEARRKPIDAARLLAFCQENGFRGLMARVQEVAGAAAVQRAEAKAAGSRPDFLTIDRLEALDLILAAASAAGVLAVALQADHPEPARAAVTGMALAVGAGAGYYLPLGHQDDFGLPTAGQLEESAVLARLRGVLADPSVLKVGHGIKAAIAMLRRRGIELAPVEDVMCLSYVLDGASHGHGLAELAERHLGAQAQPLEQVVGKGAKAIAFARVPLDKATEYAAEEAELVVRLQPVLKRRLIEARLTTVYETLERPLLPILAAMELRGIAVDGGHLRALSYDFGQTMAAREAEAFTLAGGPFALGSPKQLGQVLFDRLGLQMPGGSTLAKTKTGAYATGADILEDLAAAGHRLAQVVLDWRQLQKLTRTYTEALVSAVSPATGRVHTTYAMAATSTGRLSSNDPNLQNIPIRTEEGRKIREAFVAAPGHRLVSADYSQIELRVLAHMADIQPLKQAFADKVDIHSVTAARMFNKPLAEVGGDLRRSAKMINYGIVYGIGAFGLAQRLGIAQSEAKAFIEAYFEQYPGIRAYMEATKQQAREQGWVATIWGRRCYVPDINQKLPSRRSAAERQAINAPVQGTAADIIKRAMIKLERALLAEHCPARLLLQVHDELVLEVPEDAVAMAKPLIRRAMEEAASLTVPLEVEIGDGVTWGSAH